MQLQIWYTTWVWGVACQNKFQDQICQGSELRKPRVPQKFWDPYLFLQMLNLMTSSLVHYTGWVLGVAYQKQLLKPKLDAMEASKKCATSYLFLQPLKLAISNLVHNMNSDLPCEKQVLRPK